MTPSKFDGKRLGKRPYFFLRGATNNGNVNVNSARSGRLCVTHDVNFGQGVSDNQGRLAHESERSTRCRIEIEMQVVGPFDIIAARVPGIQVNTSQVHDPQKRRRILHTWKADHFSGG